ncbi:DNA internalization-related competence protein ComEC/Rec2 [Thermosulfurimonas dismutans]|uniref:Metallo-beta-lactamase domain-containing protein n=1 Tax=Thermosulfurimonas dismutans TaxID=999894 RepID=A0A179D3Y4_9BACT|nr:DNA internalization-related competence protein ComEC/Rec2 [Thermosulfurimonas dismutans]OAQ20693.1 hypothetical protein TDIS_1149 [Thermosulfurimonas dismutans]
MIIKSPLQAAALGLSLGLLFYFWWVSPSLHNYLGETLVEGQILNVSPYAGRTILEVKTFYGKGILFMPFEAWKCLPGRFFKARTFPTSSGYLNLFDTPRERHLLARGLFFAARVKRIEDISCFDTHRSSVLLDFRAHLFDFARRLSPLAQGLFSALVLGEKGPLPEEFKETLKAQGLYHFLAVSGFHLGLIYGMIYFAFRRLWVRIFPSQGIPAQIPAAFFALWGAAFYALLSGPSPSAQRALIMLLLFTLSRVLFLRTSGFDLLAGTVFTILILSPESILDLSFRLSVAAVLGILVGHRLYRKLSLPPNRFVRYLLGSFFVSLGASLATLPLLLFAFGEAPLLSPLNTLILSPFWCLILIPGEMVVAGLSFLSEDLAHELAEFLGGLFERAVHLPLPNLVLTPPYPVGLFILTSFSLALGIHFGLRKRYKPALILVSVTALFLFSGLFVRYALFYSVVLDIGRGNAILVHLPGDRNLLFDAGARYGSADLGKRILVPTLRKLGIGHLDFVIISHPDLDHTGGLPALLESVPVTRILSGKFRREDWQKLGLSPPLDEVVRPEVLKVSSAEIFLFSGTPESRNTNRESLMAYLEYEGLTVFFPGDADGKRLARLFRFGGTIPAEIFILPHHGARNGYFAPFWQAIDFRVAVASARGPRHPHPSVLKILKLYHRPLYVTAQEGTITVFLKRNGFLVCSARPLKKGLPLELIWPYIPYLNEQGCQRYELHAL